MYEIFLTHLFYVKYYLLHIALSEIFFWLYYNMYYYNFTKSSFLEAQPT